MDDEAVALQALIAAKRKRMPRQEPAPVEVAISSDEESVHDSDSVIFCSAINLPVPDEARQLLIPNICPNRDIQEKTQLHSVLEEEFPSTDAFTETRRLQAVHALRNKLSTMCEKLGITIPSHLFEEWQFVRKLADKTGPDPLIPYTNNREDEGLHKSLCELGMDASNASAICMELGKAATQAVNTILRHSASGTHKRVCVHQIDEQMQLSLGKAKVRINRAHYQKLLYLFTSYAHIIGFEPCVTTSSEGKAEMEATDQFHTALYTLLTRYEALCGGGFQAAVHDDVMQVCHDYFNVTMECFASPFNCRFERYCSAFVDTDAPFGSVGSFFEFSPTSGAFEANPPFVPHIIEAMAKRMEVLMSQTQQALTFIVTKNHMCVRLGGFYELLTVLWQGYHEGSQHWRNTLYRISTCDTTIFVLQTAAAVAECHNSSDEAPCVCGGTSVRDHMQQFEEEIRKAFISRHITIADRKQARNQSTDGSLDGAVGVSEAAEGIKETQSAGKPNKQNRKRKSKPQRHQGANKRGMRHVPNMKRRRR